MIVIKCNLEAKANPFMKQHGLPLPLQELESQESPLRWEGEDQEVGCKVRDEAHRSELGEQQSFREKGKL